MKAKNLSSNRHARNIAVTLFAATENETKLTIVTWSILYS